MASVWCSSASCYTDTTRLISGTSRSCSRPVPVFGSKFMMPNSKMQNKLSMPRSVNSKMQNKLSMPKYGYDVNPYMRAVIPNQTDSNIRIFSGSANPALAQEIADSLGLDLGNVIFKTFADREIYVRLLECVMGRDVYIVQPTCKPANDNIMELNAMIDACRRADAKSITAVIPYFGYARGDRMNQDGESITAKLVADNITKAGAHRVLVMDLHAGQLMGFFDVPVNHVCSLPVILDYLASKGLSSKDLVVVSPDSGGVPRARAFSKALCNVPLAIIDKRRLEHNVAQVMNLIGDVDGKVAIMFDDIIDTAGTMAQGAALLRQKGAKEVYGCATHAVFSPPAIERLSGGLFDEVIVTNTIPSLEENYFPQLTVLSVANILAEKIWHLQDSR